MTDQIPEGWLIISIKNLIAAVGVMTAALWPTWKGIVSKRLAQIDDHEERITEIEGELISAKDLRGRLQHIDETVTEVWKFLAKGGERHNDNP